MTKVISIAIANPNRLQKRMTSHPLEVWMLLPFTEEELQEAMASIGSPDEYGDYYLSGAETCGYEINPPLWYEHYRAERSSEKNRRLTGGESLGGYEAGGLSGSTSKPELGGNSQGTE